MASKWLVLGRQIIGSFGEVLGPVKELGWK
jgi:hypothetical protein